MLYICQNITVSSYYTSYSYGILSNTVSFNYLFCVGVLMYNFNSTYPAISILITIPNKMIIMQRSKVKRVQFYFFVYFTFLTGLAGYAGFMSVCSSSKSIPNIKRLLYKINELNHVNYY